jgi:hypothetical protein
MLRPPIERHAIKMIWFGEPDKFLPLAIKSKKALLFRYRTYMRGPLPDDLEDALAYGNDKSVFELAHEAMERSRNRARCINFNVIPRYVDVYPIYPGQLDDPKNYVGTEASLWMARNCRIVYAPVPKATYDELMKLYEEGRAQGLPPTPSNFDVVIKPNWYFGIKKINGNQWAYMRFKTETLPRQRDEWYEHDRHIHLLNDHAYPGLFEDWFLETCQPALPSA